MGLFCEMELVKESVNRHLTLLFFKTKKTCLINQNLPNGEITVEIDILGRKSSEGVGRPWSNAHIMVKDRNRPLAQVTQTDNGVNECCLPGTVGTKETKKLSLFDLKVDPLEGLKGSKFFFGIDDGDGRHYLASNNTIEAGGKKQEARGRMQKGGDTIKHYKDLEVHRLSYDLAMEIFWLSREFPKEELYSLTSQIVRSSRSIPANIAEGWSKREHKNIFKKHLLDAMGSTDETKTWLDFAKDCKYISTDKLSQYVKRYEEVGRKLYNLHENWQTF